MKNLFSRKPLIFGAPWSALGLFILLIGFRPAKHVTVGKRRVAHLFILMFFFSPFMKLISTFTDMLERETRMPYTYHINKTATRPRVAIPSRAFQSKNRYLGHSEG